MIKRVANLEEKNNDLKMRVKAYKPESDWGQFKIKVNQDLKNLGQSFSAFTSKERS